MLIKDNLKYTESHEWVEYLSESTARVGLTDFAQGALGDLVFVNLPSVGDEVFAGEVFADVESVKAVSDVFCPVTGKIIAVNDALLDSPGLINEDPYGAWLVEVGEISGTSEFMTGDEYEASCAEEE